MIDEEVHFTVEQYFFQMEWQTQIPIYQFFNETICVQYVKQNNRF